MRESRLNSLGNNILSKYTHLSLSQIEESEHEISANTKMIETQQATKRVLDEKDLTIEALQEKISLLLHNAQISVNLCHNEVNG